MSTAAIPPVGIDLGTTNSLIGALVDGKPRLFADASGAELLPSVVGAGPGGELYVGRAAKNRRLLDPRGTVVSVKRSMGTDVRLEVGKRELSPPQVSALILGALLDRAEAALGSRPTRAVITVPAYFGEAQRQATRDAGAMAGLTVERLVNEPTAAALTYQSGAEELVMVYDLGGGTFDVSVLERDEGLLEVRASRGDTHLGGDDIDRALSELVLARLGAARAAVEADPRAMTRVVEAAERAKIALSDKEEVRLFDPFLTGEGADAVHLDLALTRADVEEVARPFVQRTLSHVDAALRDAGVAASAASRILLVGGASKMPLVRRMVAGHLGRPVHVDLDADRAVALGASLLAGRIGGADVDEVLVDITPHTLAVGAADQAYLEGREPELRATTVIPRNTVVPVERTRTVYTLVPEPGGRRDPHRPGRATAPLRQHPPRRRAPSPPSRPGPPRPRWRSPSASISRACSTSAPSTSPPAAAPTSTSPTAPTSSPRCAAAAPAPRSRRCAPRPRRRWRARATATSRSPAPCWAGPGSALDKEGGDEAARDKVRAAATALEGAIEAKDAEVMDRSDELSDALLDLI